MNLEPVLRDLCALENVVWVVGTGSPVSENEAAGMMPPTFDKGLATITGGNWHFHLDTAAVSRVELVESQNPRSPSTYYVRLVNGDGGSPVRCYFKETPSDGHPKSAEMTKASRKAFEDLSSRYATNPDVTRVTIPAK